MNKNDLPTGAASRARAILIPCLKAGVSVALLALLFSKVDVARLWTVARTASIPWLVLALALYLGMILVSAWRWGLLLRAQHIIYPFRGLTSSFLVATFFNNFLPSNIGGDVIRITDTAPAAGSKTLATTVVLIDRGIGLLGLALVAAMGASAGLGPAKVGPLGPGMLWAGFGVAAMLATPALLNPEGFTRILQPLRVLHPEWVGERLERLTAALSRFKESPASLASCFVGSDWRPGHSRRVLPGHRPQLADPDHVRPAGGDRPDFLHRPDGPGVDERVRRPGGDVRLLLHAPGTPARIGSSGLLHRRGTRSAVLALGWRDLRRPPAASGGTQHRPPLSLTVSR